MLRGCRISASNCLVATCTRQHTHQHYHAHTRNGVSRCCHRWFSSLVGDDSSTQEQQQQTMRWRQRYAKRRPRYGFIPPTSDHVQEYTETQTQTQTQADQRQAEGRLDEEGDEQDDEGYEHSVGPSDHYALTGRHWGDELSGVDKQRDADIAGLKNRASQLRKTAGKTQKKRANTTPFNPLPGWPDELDEYDVPPPDLLRNVEWERLPESIQIKLRAHRGLRRLRRNEQKLARLAAMQKPSKVDLLMLLNELNYHKFKDSAMFQKYIGVEKNMQEMEPDFDYIDAKELDLNDQDPVDVVDESLLQRDWRRQEYLQILREEKEKQLRKAEEARSRGEPGIIGYEAAEAEVLVADHELAQEQIPEPEADKYNPNPVFGPEEAAQLAEEQYRLDVAAAVDANNMLRLRELHEQDVDPFAEPLTKNEKGELRNLVLPIEYPELHQAGINWEDEEFKPTPLDIATDEVTYMERDLIEEEHKAMDKRQQERIDRANETPEERQQRAERKQKEAKEELVKDLTEIKEDWDAWRQHRRETGLQHETLDLLTRTENLTQEEQDRMNQQLMDLTKDVNINDEETAGVWRVKQELVASWRAFLKNQGLELDQSRIDEVMQEDEDDPETIWREEREDQERDQISRLSFIHEARQKIARQKAWLRELRQAHGTEQVTEWINNGMIELKTYFALQRDLMRVQQQDTMQMVMEAEAYTDHSTRMIQAIDEEVKSIIGDKPELLAKFQRGEPLSPEELPSGEALMARLEANRKALAADAPSDEEQQDTFFKALLDRDYNWDADQLESAGDLLGAKKLRLMAQRIDAARAADSGTKTYTLDQLSGPVRDPSVPPVHQAQFGVMSAEEIAVNRELIARGDGANPYFVDPDSGPESFPFTDDRASQSPIYQMLLAKGAAAAGGTAKEMSSENWYQRYNKMTPEEQDAVNERLDEFRIEENDDFDDYVLGNVPVAFQNKCMRDWNKLTEEERKQVKRIGRRNREQLREEMWHPLTQTAEGGVGIDPLAQYWIDEEDPKQYNTIEGAFWHVGRYDIDERTEAQKKAAKYKKVVQRIAPDTPDTQTLLDRVESDILETHEEEQATEGVDEDDETELETADDADQPADADRQADADQQADAESADRAALVANQDDVDEDEYDEDEDEDDDQPVYSSLPLDPDLDYGDNDPPAQRGPAKDVADDEDDVMNSGLSEDELADPEGNPRQVHLEENFKKMRRRMVDHDPVPSGDQRAFDDQYLHYDEEDYAFLKRLDPIGVQGGQHRPPISEETLWNSYVAATGAYKIQRMLKGQQYLSQDTRYALYRLHQSNPSVWTPSAIAMKFRMSHAHVRGILALQISGERRIAHGVKMQDDEDLMTDVEQKEEVIASIKAAAADNRVRSSLALREEGAEHLAGVSDYEPTSDAMIQEVMLHYLPHLARPPVPDVRFVTENDMAAVIQEEKDIEERFLNQQKKFAKREAEQHAREGPLGVDTSPSNTRKRDPTDNYQHPEVIDKQRLLPPINYHLTLTDISELPASRFGMVTRDVTGWLRQPTPIEFAVNRRKEKSEKDRFVYVEFKPQRKVPV